jgi:uncharacterized protein
MAAADRARHGGDALLVTRMCSAGSRSRRSEEWELTMGFLSKPWPWFVAGPLIGLCVPALLLLGNRPFGISSNLRHLCSALAPGHVDFFQYDWRERGGWNLCFLAGMVVGGFVAARVMGAPDVSISPKTHAALVSLGVHDFSGLAPQELFSWRALFTLRGFVSVVVGGFLVGFGTAYAAGCTSGHAIAGLADFQLPSLLAVIGFFAGGLIATHWILPWLF